MQIRSRKGGRRCACEMCPITTPGALGMQMSNSQTRTECGTYRISLNIFEYYSNIYHTLAILRFPWPKDETCSCLADCSQLVVWGKFAFSFEFIRSYMLFHVSQWSENPTILPLCIILYQRTAKSSMQVLHIVHLEDSQVKYHCQVENVR